MKKWTLSDSGLQIYDGKKHIATVHYGGNPIVDINEAIENAKIIQQAAALRAERDNLAAANAELRKALETLLNIFAAPRAAGTNVDGKWMGIPDWETVEEVASVLAKWAK